MEKEYSSLSVFLLLLLLVNIPHSLSFNGKCHEEEKNALLEFKATFFNHSCVPGFYSGYPADEVADLKTWGSEGKNGDCCNYWDGVECDNHTGHVIGLNLSHSCLSGSIDSRTTIFKLTHLRTLLLSFNDFRHSQIPSAISNLSRLEILYLSESNISGQIPSEILNLTNLSYLALSGDQLALKNPSLGDLVQSLVKLKGLELFDVEISSPIPDSLFQLTSLRYLYLVACKLQGQIPPSLSNLTNLESLDLSGNQLTGEIPPSLSNLTKLAYLGLSSNQLTGEIPPSLSNLTKLEVLDLLGNQLIGEIPPSLSNLTKLESLYLSSNQLTGEIPPSLSNLTKLESLYLLSNQLTGEIPRSLSNLTKLESLDLSGNQLIGEIPPSLSNLTKLESLDLSGNQLTGEIPPSLSNLTKLEVLYLSGNQFTGEIFPQLLRLTKLRDVELSNNNFSGQIPGTISHLKNLTYLHLGSNNFSGETHLDSFFQLDSLHELDLSYNNFSWVIDNSVKPTSKLHYLFLASSNLRSFPLLLQNQYSLEYLDLSSNDISGEVPQWLMDVNMENLTYLDLSHNHLSGFEGNFPLLKWSLQTLDLRFNQLKGSLPIPSTSSSLNYYFVSNNQFSGELPTGVCDLVSLQVFDIGNNNFSGMIPRCLVSLVGMGKLSVLNLHNNSFSGPVPQVGKNRCNLMMIDMSYNQLEGPMPRDINNCPHLEFLNMGNNKINDVFPSWLGSTNLSVLILRSNRFRGIIEKPSYGHEFPKLQIINLSKNNFIGCLPAWYFEGWRAMKVDAHEEDRTMSYASFKDGFYFYTVSIASKGIEIEYTKIPESFAVIDLSTNHFTGEIPTSISTLKGLRSLNLSNNILAGSIPFQLNDLRKLESVDLSHNNLSGNIPQQLTDLSALEFFDVSFNQLIGPIPQTNQFGTFENSSYRGNPGLCGLPLSRKCGNVTDSSPPPTLKEDHVLRNWIEIDWKIVSMGYASGFVIGVVMGMYWTRGCKRVGRIRQINFILS